MLAHTARSNKTKHCAGGCTELNGNQTKGGSSSLCLPSVCTQLFGQRSFSYTSLSGPVSLAKLGHQTCSHLSNHLSNLTSSNYPADCPCMCMYVCRRMHACVRVGGCTCMCVCVCVCVWMHVHMCVCVYMYACMCVCVAQLCRFALCQWWEGKSWLVIFILLPNMSDLFLMSLTQTAGHKVAALTIMCSQLSNINI